MKTLASCRGLKAESRSGGYLFLMVIVVQAGVVNAGAEALVLLLDKEESRPYREMEGRIRPAATESVIYLSIASFSGLERLYNRLVGRADPGYKSMVQSYGL